MKNKNTCSRQTSRLLNSMVVIAMPELHGRSSLTLLQLAAGAGWPG